MKQDMSPVRPAGSVSRRSMLAVSSLWTVPATVAQDQPASDLEQARGQVAKNAEALAKVDMPRSVEPTFRFEA